MTKKATNQMKTRAFIAAGLAAPLLLLCAWPTACVAQSAIAYAVAAWGHNGEGQTDVPVVAQSGVTAIAAGHFQTVALIGGVQLLPSLKVRPNGNELILSWPTNAPGFTLQSTLDVTPHVTWIDSTNTPTVVGAHVTLTNSTSGGARFLSAEENVARRESSHARRKTPWIGDTTNQALVA